MRESESESESAKANHDRPFVFVGAELACVENRTSSCLGSAFYPRKHNRIQPCESCNLSSTTHQPFRVRTQHAPPVDHPNPPKKSNVFASFRKQMPAQAVLLLFSTVQKRGGYALASLSARFLPSRLVCESARRLGA